MFRAGAILIAAIFLIVVWPIPASYSQGPAPSGGNGHEQPQAHAATAQSQTAQEPDGTKNNPAFVQLEDSEQQREEADKHASYEQQEATNDWWIATFTVILGFVGILELGILGLQIYWMRRTVIESNKQHALTERANVVPATFNRELSTAVDELAKQIQGPMALQVRAKLELDVRYFAVQPVWANTGNTPTQRMRIRVDWGDGNERPVGNYREPWQEFFIAPKSTETSEFIEMPGLNELIQDGAAGVGGRRVPLRLIWGAAEYEDVFDKKHWLRWCYRIRASRPNPGQGLKITLIQHGDHNAASDKAK